MRSCAPTSFRSDVSHVTESDHWVGDSEHTRWIGCTAGIRSRKRTLTGKAIDADFPAPNSALIVETSLRKATLAGLILLNVFDIVLHIAIDRAEPIRITGNTLIILAAAYSIFSTSLSNGGWAVAAGLVGYVGLNAWFVLQLGIGPVGVGLIGLTSVISGIYLLRARPY